MIQALIFTGIWLAVIPFFMGLAVCAVIKREQTGAGATLAIGYLTMFALCQLICVPMILLKVRLSVFCMIFGGVCAVIALGGLIGGRKLLCRLGKSIPSALHQSWAVYASAAAVLGQAYFYFKYMVTNLDDAYFVAAATTAVETDTMYLYSPYTGRAVIAFNLRYCLSPFPMFQAFLSKCIRVHPSTLAHTILAPLLVIVAYVLYWQLGRFLLAGPDGEMESSYEKNRKAGLFVLFLSMINVTSYYCVHTQGSMLLLRIWQGKAVLAAIGIPYLFYLCYRMYRHPKEYGNLLLLLIGTAACCLVSSMGIALPPVLLGIFAVLFGIFGKNRRYFLQMLTGCLPCVVFGLLYIVMRMVQA